MTENIVEHVGSVTRELRNSVLGGAGCTVLLTGLSGSGKSTIGFAAEKQLLEGGRAAFVLDGDNLRFGLNSDLGFSADDRSENVRRVSEVARLMSEAGMITFVPLIAPYAADRHRARQIHETADVAFLEVFIDTPLEVCETRDPKGLYKRARAGEIVGMTGIDAPYESPASPDLLIHTATTSILEAAQMIVDLTLGRTAR
jgi:bifunctional enzyme CysN/CysC